MDDQVTAADVLVAADGCVRATAALAFQVARGVLLTIEGQRAPFLDIDTLVAGQRHVVPDDEMGIAADGDAVVIPGIAFVGIVPSITDFIGTVELLVVVAGHIITRHPRSAGIAALPVMIHILHFFVSIQHDIVPASPL